MLKEQSVRLNALVDDILALARLEKAEADKMTNFVPCNIADIVQTAVNLARPQAAKSDVDLVFSPPSPSAGDLAPRTLTRPCDPRLVESAVSNLIQNAIRHSGSKTVKLDIAATSDGKAIIRVTDHGVGIPKECRPRLFERFYRIDKNRSRALGGTGLGLAIVKHIVQLHGGEVTVTSAPDEGAVFQLVI